MIYSKISKNRLVISSLFFLLIFAYIILRAHNLSFTHDESLSFAILEGRGRWLFSANNHPLNTLLMYLNNIVFGSSEFSLRLPNVLSFIPYFIGCTYIFNTSTKTWLFFFGMSFCLLNPFLLEFFSLARGYGLSMGFILMSLYFLVRTEKKYTTFNQLIKDFKFSVLFASLAVFSNLSTVNYLIAIIFIFLIKFLIFQIEIDIKNKLKLYKSFFYRVLISCIPLAISVIHLLELKSNNQLYVGAPSLYEGFNSLIINSIYFSDYPIWINTLIIVFATISILIGIVFLIYKRKTSGPLFYITLLIAILITGLYIENIFFDAKFPMERTAVFYFPIFIVFAYYLFREFLERKKIKSIYYVPTLMVLILPIYFNLFIGINLSHTKVWEYDANTKEAMTIIREETKGNKKKSSISNHWLFEPAINYYISTWELNLNRTNRKGMKLNTDYIYGWGKDSFKETYDVIGTFNSTNTELFKKKN